MSNIVFSDEDVKRLGGYRWDAKNQKKYVIQRAIVAAFGVLGVVAIEKYPSNWLPVILVSVLMFASVYIYTQNEITKPKKQYAEQFLRDVRS
jgi:1,4-dihydroxy-2-naphthoate octaprenyltransferase